MNIKMYNQFNIGREKIIIGVGAVKAIASEIENAGVTKVLIVTDRGIVDSGLMKIVENHLNENQIPFEIYAEVKSDPSSAFVDKGLKLLRNTGCDGVIGVGGGSSMDVAKGIRIMATNDGSIFDYDNSPTGGKTLKHGGLFLICVPTTAGTGSEVTPYAIISNEVEKRKATISGKENSADVAILDPTFTLKLPPHITASTGMDALAHAAGAITSGRVIEAAGDTVLSDIMGYKAIELIGENLRAAYCCGKNIEVRKNMQLASMLGAMASNAGSDACHGIGHALGAIYHVPHGIACAAIMPEIWEYNLISAPERYQKIAVALGEKVEGLSVLEAAQRSVTAVKKLIKDINIPPLSEYIKDVQSKQFEELCIQSEKEKCSKINPRPITKEIARQLILKAMERELQVEEG